MNHAIATLTTSSFVGVGILNGIAAHKRPVPNLLSLSILLIAYVHYRYMSENVEWYRHSDWLLTCPLLVYEIAYLIDLQPFGQDGGRVALAAAAAILMVWSGWKARQANVKWTWWLVGAVCLGMVYYQLLYDNSKPHKNRPLGEFYLYCWIPYGMVFWAPWELRQTMYTLLDFVSKSTLGAIIAYQSLA